MLCLLHHSSTRRDICTAETRSSCRRLDRTGFKVWIIVLGHCSLLSKHTNQLVQTNRIVLEFWFIAHGKKMLSRRVQPNVLGCRISNTVARDAFVGHESWEVERSFTCLELYIILTHGFRRQKWSGHVHTHNRMLRGKISAVLSTHRL